ncbi:hypothetical protein BJY52DRAFT_1292214 [Lactarius psammicola]|nr:hypothetical protein BJY52DRAFT_1292214 [Lactarius psammicola]
MAMDKRNMVVDDVLRSPLLSIRCASLSIFIASVSLLLVFISAPLPGKLETLSGESLDRPQQNVELQPLLAPGSDRNDVRMKFKNIHPTWREAARSTGNTVAVVLNWSRFENVRRIAFVLCNPELDPIIEHVLVWNNNPKPLTYSDFLPTTCSEEKLRIVNSAENMYFHARFLGCSQSDSEYCFVQDDDYLVLPEVIHTLHARVTELGRPSAVHLLPPHERLSSDLRVVYAGNGANAFHTSFSWLGHGTMMHRSLASEFLSLLQILNISNEEVKMADNYFTVLRNHPPETWFDQGIELGGGQAFTVGSEGHERNKKHILRACYYLDTVLGSEVYRGRAAGGKHPFISIDNAEGSFAPAQGLAACLGRPCLFETTISLLPNEIKHSCERAQDMLDIEERNLRILGDKMVHYSSYPPSFAVDGKPDTAFRSPRNATRGDTITLDMLRDVSVLYSHTQIVFLVDEATVRILRTCKFQTSPDSRKWTTLSGELACVRVDLEKTGNHLLECSTGTGDLSIGSISGTRYFRAHLTGDREERWSIHEMWIRGHST